MEEEEEEEEQVGYDEEDEAVFEDVASARPTLG